MLEADEVCERAFEAQLQRLAVDRDIERGDAVHMRGCGARVRRDEHRAAKREDQMGIHGPHDFMTPA